MDISEFSTATHLDPMSDGLPLMATISWTRFPKSLQILRPKTLDVTLYKCYLAMEIGKIIPLPSSITSVSLTKLVDGLTEAIYIAYNGSTGVLLGTIKVIHSRLIHTT